MTLIGHIITNDLNLVPITLKWTGIGVVPRLQGALLPPARCEAGVGPLAGPHLVAALNLIPKQLCLPQPSAWSQHSFRPLQHRILSHIWLALTCLPSSHLGDWLLTWYNYPDAPLRCWRQAQHSPRLLYAFQRMTATSCLARPGHYNSISAHLRLQTRPYIIVWLQAMESGGKGLHALSAAGTSFRVTRCFSSIAVTP